MSTRHAEHRAVSSSPRHISRGDDDNARCFGGPGGLGRTGRVACGGLTGERTGDRGGLPAETLRVNGLRAAGWGWSERDPCRLTAAPARVNAAPRRGRRLSWNHGDTYFPLAVSQQEEDHFWLQPRDDVKEERCRRARQHPICGCARVVAGFRDPSRRFGAQHRPPSEDPR